MRSWTCTTFIFVVRCRSSGNDPLVRGIEVLDDHVSHAADGRNVAKEFLQASRPPAEAPMPTTENETAPAAGGCLRVRGLGVSFWVETGVDLEFIVHGPSFKELPPKINRQVLLAILFYFCTIGG